MDTQEAYETMREFFSRPDAQLAREERSTGGITCAYRLYMDEGSPLKCAVGCLIPDELYDAKMEESAADELTRDWPTLGFLGDVKRDFLADAQVAHDTSKTTQEFVEALDSIAEKDYGLKLTTGP